VDRERGREGERGVVTHIDDLINDKISCVNFQG